MTGIVFYRQHRGWLTDSMATAKTVRTIDDIAAIEEQLVDMGHDLSQIKVEPYGYDARIGWDTHAVTLPGYGILGFTSGPLPTPPSQT